MMVFMIRRGWLAALVGTLVLSACTSIAPSPSPGGSPVPSPSTGNDPGPVEYPADSLAAFLAADQRFGTFLDLMERDAFLLDRLLANPTRKFTLFLPTDEAFDTLSPSTIAGLDSDASAVTGIVERHFLMQRLPEAEFATGYVFAGMSRRMSRLALVVDGDRIWFGDARVIETDLEVGPGIIHLINRVNLGPTPNRVPVP